MGEHNKKKNEELEKVKKSNIRKYCKCPEIATGGVYKKNLFLKILQYSQEDTCIGVSF